MNGTILVVAAHPDDEILGCGGAIARYIKEGRKVFTLLLGEGVTARMRGADAVSQGKAINVLRKQACKANDILGVQQLFTYNFPDNRFDTVPFLDIVRSVQKIKQQVKPDIIFTHFARDLNIDHRITYQAVITAARPLPKETVKEIYSFEILSSTEWNYALSFSPNTFINIKKTLTKKIKAARAYGSEMRVFPHTRSLEGIATNAKQWGMKSGMVCAEAFVCVRCIR